MVDYIAVWINNRGQGTIILVSDDQWTTREKFVWDIFLCFCEPNIVVLFFHWIKSQPPNERTKL